MSRTALKNIAKLLNDTQVDVPVPDLFIRDLKRSIELTEDRNIRKPSQTYKPSSMQCMRNMYYQRVGVMQDEAHSNACLVGICETGTDRHIRLQNAISRMKECGIDCEYINVEKFVRERNLQDLEIVSHIGNETKLYNASYDLSFMCDGIIRYNGHYYILEIKTESGYKWTSRTGVDKKHENQATAYSFSFDISEVLFLYVSRDTCDMKCYLFNVTEQMRNKLRALIADCEKCVRDKTVPMKPDDLPRNVCEYCNYKKQCRLDG